jgi:anti-anti-sigma factor
MEALHEGPVSISLHGAYDISSDEALRRLLSVAERAREAVIDLSDVSYAGTTLLNALLDLRARMCAHGTTGTIRLIGCNPQLRRILRITRLDRVFDIA